MFQVSENEYIRIDDEKDGNLSLFNELHGIGQHRTLTRMPVKRKRCAISLTICLIIPALIMFVGLTHSGTMGCGLYFPAFGREGNIGCQIRKAQVVFRNMLVTQSKDQDTAVKEYGRRYKRSPPPGFTEWVRFALDHNSTIIDDFDVLERNLAPLRGLSGDKIRARIKSLLDTGMFHHLEIKNGKAEISGMRDIREFLDPIAEQLPDVRIPLNLKDEPIVVGSGQTKGNNDIVKIGDALDEGIADTLAFKPCSWTRPYALDKRIRSSWLDESKDICRHTELKNLHGFLQAPDTYRYISTLLPVASVSKISTFADLLMPPRCYFIDKYRKSAEPDEIAFEEKLPVLYWRGKSTGIHASEINWMKGHRQRLILTAEKIRQALLRSTLANWPGRWWKQSLRSWNFDLRFVDTIQCPKEVCKIQKESMGLAPHAPTSEAHKYKFVFDVDGNGMSCRYYRLLESNSIVFKQTIHQEWHDERLIPWVHFVPISMGMEELPTVLDYFANTKEGEHYGKKIAYESRKWAQDSLRKVDASIYWYRLILEYATLFNS